jgi:hypothetical protein
MSGDAVVKLKEKEAQIRKLQGEKSRLEGRKEQLLSTLKEKFGINTLEEGQKLLAEKEEELQETVVKMNSLFDEMDGIVKGATSG